MSTKICPVCHTPGCIEMRGPNFHEGRRFGSKTCDYTGTPPFADAAWAKDPDALCLWCAGTGHPHGDESYGICKCPQIGLSQSDLDQIYYFWREKRDPTRWAGWEASLSFLKKDHPEILRAWAEYQASMENMNSACAGAKGRK